MHHEPFQLKDLVLAPFLLEVPAEVDLIRKVNHVLSFNLLAALHVVGQSLEMQEKEGRKGMQTMVLLNSHFFITLLTVVIAYDLRLY